MVPSPESLYLQLGYVIAETPALPDEGGYLPPSFLQWLGKVHALVSAVGDAMDMVELRAAANDLQTGFSIYRFEDMQKIAAVLYRALAIAELKAPTAVQGAFIPAGNAFDAMTAVGKVLAAAKQQALIVDPYMDEKTLTDFAVLAPAAVSIHLLADQAHHKPSLKPMVGSWIKQYGSNRPLEAKLAPARTLHDRLIAADGAQVWTLTQSLNAFAARSPATIVRVDPETAALKIDAYEAMWAAAAPL
jgi:hypothetical protein